VGEYMIGKITYINGNIAKIKPDENLKIANDLINMLVVFEDGQKKIIGEIQDIDFNNISIRFLGELFSDGRFTNGVLRKPNLNSTIREISMEELNLLVGLQNEKTIVLGNSPLYEGLKINIDVNDLFSGHFAIFGNSGSGKSFSVSRIMQNLYQSSNNLAQRSNIFIFDASGEYHNAFRNINQVNPNINFKVYTTLENNQEGFETLRIPLWLLSVDDYVLLLDAAKHSQIAIIEKMLKIVSIFSQNDELTNRYKNHLIASALLSVLYSSETPTKIRNNIFSIVSSVPTPEFNLNAQIPGVGYTRSFRKCFELEKTGSFAEGVLISNYITSFIDESLDKYEVKYGNFFTLEDLQTALNFTLISEGLLDNEETYNDAISLKVRLHSIVTGPYSKFFEYDKHVTASQFISSILVTKEGKRAQIVNFNIEDIDDRFSKIIVKIFSKLLFDFAKKLPSRASMPFHIVLEEAHRYVQNDNDRFLLGYNIFDRIAKEGRKYGVLLEIITQRPVELNETVISQCSNFLIFRMNHPNDVDFMSKMVPNISEDIIDKQKNLQPGTCIAFGTAFKIPTIIKFDKPNPEPLSNNCNIYATWRGTMQTQRSVETPVNNTYQEPVVAPTPALDKPEEYRSYKPDIPTTSINLDDFSQSGMPNVSENLVINPQESSIPPLEESRTEVLNPINGNQGIEIINNQEVDNNDENTGIY